MLQRVLFVCQPGKLIPCAYMPLFTGGLGETGIGVYGWVHICKIYSSTLQALWHTQLSTLGLLPKSLHVTCWAPLKLLSNFDAPWWRTATATET